MAKEIRKEEHIKKRVLTSYNGELVTQEVKTVVEMRKISRNKSLLTHSHRVHSKFPHRTTSEAINGMGNSGMSS